MLDYRRYATPVWALQVWSFGEWHIAMTGRAGAMLRLCDHLRHNGMRCRVRIRYADGEARHG